MIQNIIFKAVSYNFHLEYPHENRDLAEKPNEVEGQKGSSILPNYGKPAVKSPDEQMFPEPQLSNETKMLHPADLQSPDLNRVPAHKQQGMVIYFTPNIILFFH